MSVNATDAFFATPSYLDPDPSEVKSPAMDPTTWVPWPL